MKLIQILNPLGDQWLDSGPIQSQANMKGSHILIIEHAIHARSHSQDLVHINMQEQDHVHAVRINSGRDQDATDRYRIPRSMLEGCDP